MTAALRLDWKGAAIAGAMQAAAKRGIDETMAECVLQAQTFAPRRTGAMANNIAILQRAEASGSRVSGLWGNSTQPYTLFVEIGAGGRPGRYFLRRSRDIEYPRLAARIAAWARR